MRLIGNVENEKQAFVFYSYLLARGIHSTYETAFDPEQKKNVILMWIYEEDEIEKAVELLNEFKQNPSDPKFLEIDSPVLPPLPPDRIAQPAEEKISQQKGPPTWKMKIQVQHHKIRPHPITFFIIILCALLYFWNSAEQVALLKEDGRLGLEFGFTKVQQKLMVDYPEYNLVLDRLLEKYPLKSFKDIDSLPSNELAEFKEAQRIPTWRGALPLLLQSFKKKPDDQNLKGPLFQKIREGEYWRLFTPALLHGGFLHILFNMAWVFILVRQVEERLAKWKTILVILLLGIGTNIAQYLVSGPYFLGFSGIVVGLVGFIWTRQKIAPWEGYPLQRTTIIFILIFIGAMFALELFTLLTALFSGQQISANIANTAHIVGGLIGLLLGRIPLFARRMK